MSVSVITLIVEDEPDLLSRVAEHLNDFGVNWEQLHRVPGDQGVQHWQLTAVETDLDGGSLDVRRDTLRHLPGVVDMIVFDNIAPATSDADGDRAMAGSRLVDETVPQMTRVFPAIRALMRSFERDSRVYTNRAQLSTSLGQQLGRRLALKHRLIHVVPTIEEALEKVVVGMLFPVVRTQAVDSDLWVEAGDFLIPSLLSINAVKRRFLNEPPLRCLFLAGLISGLLNHAEQLPNSRVDIAAERNSKQFSWVFRIHAE